MPEANMSERDLVEKLVEALQELPQVHARPPRWESDAAGRGRGFDADIKLEAAGKEFRLLIEVKNSLYPRDARQLFWQIKSNQPDDAGSVVPLVVANSISPGAREFLKEEGIGYYDSGGSLFLPAPGAYFYIEKPPAKTFAKTVRSLFKGKRSQVLHALLLYRESWFGVKELAELADVSSATASETLTALERFDWISSKGHGPSKERCLSDPRALLDEWSNQAAAARQLTFRRYYVPSIDADALTGQLDEFCEAHDVEYVLTQEVAAQHYAPYLTRISQVKCRMTPGRAADAVVSELGARVVSEGANLMVSETKSQGEFLFKNRMGHSWLASPVQVYLDLLRGGGRAREMAEHLRKETIGF